MTTTTTGVDREVRVLTLLISAVGVTGLACSLAPAVQAALPFLAVTVIVVGVLAVVARLGLRWARERREDRADALTAAAWRATHCPVSARQGVA